MFFIIIWTRSQGPDCRRARKVVIRFVFFNKFHEKYTKSSTLVLIKERRSAFEKTKKVQKTPKGQRKNVGNDRGERWLASSPERRG